MKRKRRNIPKMKDAVDNNAIILSQKHFIASFIPKWSNQYEKNVCWHGCDKVSTNIREFGGGGGS